MLDDITEIAAEAGRIALSRCGTDYQRWEKEPGHPVCDIDLMVDNFLRDQLIALDPEALTALGREHLAPYKVPARFEPIDALPRNPTGKILKKDLRQPHWEKAGRKV